MADPVGTAIAFGALGATVTVAAALLLFHPRGREVRWYVLFLGALALWLATLGLVHATGEAAR